VIEHLEKEEGRKVVAESERVAREQIVIFTPLGFMPQHMASNEADGWGLGGSAVQEHRSGWEPEDFGAAWSFYICKDFHGVDFKGKPLEKAHGAFYAVRNFEGRTIPAPNKISDIRRPLPSELELRKAQSDIQRLQFEMQLETQRLKNEYITLEGSRGVRIARFIKRMLGFIGIAG
jgi:hypothetical protein